MKNFNAKKLYQREQYRFVILDIYDLMEKIKKYAEHELFSVAALHSWSL